MRDFESYKDFMEKCSHCSYCEATCPVYLEDLLETHVARARMELIRAVLVDEEMPVTDRFKEIIDRCLLCTNCRQTCPVNVPVEEIVIAARNKLYKGKRMGMIKRKLLKQIMENRGISGAIGKLSNIAKVAGVKNIPDIPSKSFDDQYEAGTYPPEGEVRAKVVYYAGCATNTMFPETGDIVMKVLKKNGIEVVIPEGLSCCGIPAISEGDLNTASEMIKRNIEVLSKTDTDIIITDCTSCGMTFKEKVVNTLDVDDEFKEKAIAVSMKFREITEYLMDIGLTEKIKPVKEKVTYHVPCHRGWSETVSDAPRKLMEMIPDLTVVEMEHPEKCCGAGGAFFMENKELSEGIRSKKTGEIKQTGASILITQCPSCRSYIGNSSDNDLKIMHPLNLLLLK
ncbi:MAG: (Fe-S)-binding protein [Deltaproteobacteria bacterium]|nr:(Fe-S)-binding protein [Deltaproteobacteria bacterium]